MQLVIYILPVPTEADAKLRTVHGTDQWDLQLSSLAVALEGGLICDAGNSLYGDFPYRLQSKLLGCRGMCSLERMGATPN